MCPRFRPSTPSSNIAPAVYHLADRGSRNGTFVNGQRIDEIDLKDGDLIRLGEAGSNAVTLTYRAGQAPQSARSINSISPRTTP